MPDRYLRVDSSPDGSVVTINGNRIGLEYLQSKIQQLLNREKTGTPDDISLMLEDWGGDGLTNDKPFDGDNLVGHLQIRFWKD